MDLKKQRNTLKGCLTSGYPSIYKNHKFWLKLEYLIQVQIQEKNEPPQNFPVPRSYPMFTQFFYNVSPIFHKQNFSRFASTNVAVVWIRAWKSEYLILRNLLNLLPYIQQQVIFILRFCLQSTKNAFTFINSWEW